MNIRCVLILLFSCACGAFLKVHASENEAALALVQLARHNSLSDPEQSNGLLTLFQCAREISPQLFSDAGELIASAKVPKKRVLATKNNNCSSAGRTCSFCGKVFNSRGHLFQHLFVHSEGKIMPCPTCDQSFKSIKMRNSHFKKENGFSIKDLPSYFSVKQGDYSIMFGFFNLAPARSDCAVWGKKGVYFACCYNPVLCEKKFSSKNHLQMHLLAHIGYRGFKCPKCSGGFITPHTRNWHLRNKHKTTIENFAAMRVKDSAMIRNLIKPTMYQEVKNYE